MKSLQCITFDLDGVLVDACDWHFEALNRALMEHVRFSISKPVHETEFNGLPTRVKLQMLKIPDQLSNEIVKSKQKYTMQLIQENVRPSQSKVYMIDELKAQGLYVACVTNSIRETARAMLENLGVIKSIDVIITNEDVDEPKPSPEGHLLVSDGLGVEPDKILVVEDTDIGCRAAKAAGIDKVIRVTNATEVNYDLLRPYL